MTVYTGDIKSAITFLSTTVNAAGDLDRADAVTRATINKATQELQSALSAATATLDADASKGGLSGAPIATAGDFPPDIVTALGAAIANSTQMATLQNCIGYVGRVQLSLGGVA